MMHGKRQWRPGGLLLLTLGVLSGGCAVSPRFEQHEAVSPWRTLMPRYNTAFFDRHRAQYQFSAAIHYAHGKAHDDLQLTPLSRADYYDNWANSNYVAKIHEPPQIEPGMMYWGPYTGQAAWKLYRAIDWTHHHHEMTYDILSERDIAWDQKAAWTAHAVKVYLERNRDVARSPAVLDLTMRRAGVMMKPYFGFFRNKYPQMNNFFYLAHWWHPVIYEAMMIGGNGVEQDKAVAATHELTYGQVNENRPQRMLLSREAMPRYSRMSPESANIFDNLHMLHGIAYDIMAYEGWTIAEKRRELYRVIDAMSYQPGDEKYVRSFALPHPDMDPRVYSPWMTTYEGEMNRIMEEMLREMWPGMSPDGSAEVPGNVMEQLRMKLTPGMQENEIDGSLHTVIMQLVPKVKMEPEGMKPGKSARKMIKAMLDAWGRKAQEIEPVQPLPMDRAPEAKQTAALSTTAAKK